MNILFVSDTRFSQAPFREGAIRYRCYHMAEALQAAGYLADVTALDNIKLANLSRYDIVSVHRPSASRRLLSLLERCNKLNIRTVADLDSLEFEPSVAAESPKSTLRESSVATVRAAFMRSNLALKHFDEISVATEELARVRRAQAPNQPVYVVQNGLSNFWLSCNDRIKIKKPTKNRISYFTSTSKVESDFAMASEGINQFLTKTSDAELNIVGPLNLDATAIESPQVLRSAWADFMNVPMEFAKTWVSVAPLNNTSINYAKPHTKFIESAAFGVPIICSPTKDLERHDVPGLHLAETAEQWLQAFEALSDKQYYESCQQALHEYARDCCLASHSAKMLIERWSANNENSKDESFTTLSAAS